MSSAPVMSTLPEIDGFLNGLIESKVLDRGRVRSAWDAYQKESASPGVSDLAGFLVQRGLLTGYQAERSADGEAEKLLLGPYLLLEPLGAARFGTVFLALHRGDRRRFAVKVLPLRNLWKVQQAKKQTALFQTMPPQRAIVPLVEVDTANGSHYLSWPFVEGETLAALVNRSGPLPVGEACRVFAEVADGLALCHAAGVFHGMLSPGNILLGADGHASLLDLGLGAILAENMDDESMLDTISTANSALDMMNYSPPETIADPSVRNAAADAYGFGCVMYTAVTGALPFPEGSVVDKMIAHQTRSPVSPRTLNPDLPAELEGLIVSLLRKPPGSRPGMRGVKDVLEAISVGLPVDAPPTIPFGKLSLGYDRVEELLAEVLAAPAPASDAPPRAAPAKPYRATPSHMSLEGLIDFDVPGDVQSGNSPVSFRPTGEMPEQKSPPQLTPKSVDRAASVPELLLPVGGVLRTLSLPNSSAAAKPVAPGPISAKSWERPPAPVNWGAAPANRDPHPVRPPVVIPPPPQFSTLLSRGLRKKILFWKPSADTVQLSVFGAPEVAPGHRVNFLVYAHSPEAFSNVVTLCRALRSDSDLLGAGYLDAPVPRGTDVGIHLALTYAGVAKSLVKFTWIGQTQPRTFEVFVPWESPTGLTSGVVTAGIDKTVVATIPLHFIIPTRHA